MHGKNEYFIWRGSFIHSKNAIHALKLGYYILLRGLFSHFCKFHAEYRNESLKACKAHLK